MGVNGALAFGLQAALARTGKFQSGDEDRVEAGGRCVANLAEAVRDLVDA